MSVLTTFINVLRAISLIVWIGVGIVTFIGTWRLFQKTEVLLDTLPGQLGKFTPASGSIPKEILQQFLPPQPTRRQ